MSAPATDTRPERLPYDQPQTWYFTFGSVHAHPNGYVIFENLGGDAARDHMNAIYGAQWGFQYDAHDWFRDGVSQEAKYGLHLVGRLPG